MLEQTWIQLSFGELVRGGKHLRFYNNLFNKNPNEIYALNKISVEWFAQKIKEPQNLKPPPCYNCSEKRDILVEFEGLKDYFLQLNGYETYLNNEIRLITKPCWLNKINAHDISIGIHVRCGDFAMPVIKDGFICQGNSRTPISWFIKSLRIIRKYLNKNVQAFVCSDGNMSEIKDLLNEPDVNFLNTGSAIGDLLSLSRSHILLASGSSFSAWASFLGQMPTITHPGLRLGWFNLINSKSFYVGEFDPLDPNIIFLNQLHLAINCS